MKPVINVVLCILFCSGCGKKETSDTSGETDIPEVVFEETIPEFREEPTPSPREKTFAEKIADAAEQQIGKTTVYDPAYVVLDYPGGDIPIERGVCTDVIIRALRGVGIDLQKEIHEDMKKHFNEYPQNWNLKKPDPNIDHRRVPNITTWFKRKGYELPVSFAKEDYLTGDIVTWKLKNKRDHIGIVIRKNGNPLIIHNIGEGVKIEDRLMSFEFTGRYRLQKQ